MKAEEFAKKAKELRVQIEERLQEKATSLLAINVAGTEKEMLIVTSLSEGSLATDEDNVVHLAGQKGFAFVESIVSPYKEKLQC